jgi:hypothetical protein
MGGRRRRHLPGGRLLPESLVDLTGGRDPEARGLEIESR